MALPRILLFSNWFSPGYKAGGSQLAVASLVQGLREAFEFWVVTRDRDYGDVSSYPVAEPEAWVSNGNVHIRYLPPHRQSLLTIHEILQSTPHDLLHLNSVVSLPFAAYPVFARRWVSQSATPLLVSPHGEMAPSALKKRGFRKTLYLAAAKSSGLFRDAHWHAITDTEEKDIRRVWGEDVAISTATLFPPPTINGHQELSHPPKASGKLRAVFLSRIDQLKNLNLAIELIAQVPNATLDIYGPISQPEYWAACRAQIGVSRRQEAFSYKGSIIAENVMKILAEYDLFILPSQSESFGYAILESMGAGCPVLISDRTPWRNLQQAGVGADIPLGEKERTLDFLRYVRDMDEPSHRKFREKARQYALSYVQNSLAKQAMRNLYETMLDASRSA